MATNQSTMDYILDQLTSVDDVSARKMFGEYALYAGGKVVGLICDDTLYVKTSASLSPRQSRRGITRAESGCFC